MVIESTTPSAELLTVSAFADRAGVTTQYIYKLLNSKLAAYVTTVDNRKLISSDALNLFTTELANENSSVDNHYIDMLLTNYRLTIDCLQSEISQLVDQIAVKDEQINGIIERLHEANSISMSLSERGQQLLQAAIDEAEHPVTAEPVKVETKPGFFARLFGKIK